MGFFGVEVKPDKPHPYHSDNAQGTLYVTQATLGLGSSKERSILQCSRGHNSPIFLCSLLPGKSESCSLHLEFKDELVAFSVVGKRSIHLSGYFISEEGDYLGDEYDLDSGEDIGETESDDSSEFDYDDDDLDDDLDMFPSLEAPKRGVLNRKKRMVVLESEDEDGFPVSQDPETDGREDKSKESKTKKRKVKATEPDSQPEKKKKKKKGKKEAVADMDEDHQKELTGEETEKPADADPGSHAINGSEGRGTDAVETGKISSPKKNKKKKKKNKKADADGGGAITTVPDGNEAKSSLVSNEKQSASKARTFSNGLVIEELAMGKPDGKRASPGNQVSVQYIGKLQKNGEAFDSNIGNAPFKFRLGVGQVIKGWDVGVNGMRVGDKRRITIPPAMGYGERGAGSKIPPDSWLVFDVELVNVR